MTAPLFTIAIPTFDDTDGAIFSIQHLRTVHDLRNKEIVVVDNNPTSPKGKKLKEFCLKLYNPIDKKVTGLYGQNLCKVHYVPYTDRKGTSAPRNHCFTVANGKYTVVMDSHVFFMPQALTILEQYFERHPESSDLITGPMLMDALDGLSTHFTNEWRSEMWGAWAQAWTCGCAVDNRVTTSPPENGIKKYTRMADYPIVFEVTDSNGHAQYSSVDTIDPVHAVSKMCPTCGKKIPPLQYSGHQAKLLDAGFVPMGQGTYDEEFPIRGMGMGAFACRTKAWLGFHQDATEFGGEENWYSEKVRRAGHRHLCLPGFKWWHKFNRDAGIPYPIRTITKARNYVLEFNEIGLPLDNIQDHFVKGLMLPNREPDPHFTDRPTISQKAWDEMVANPQLVPVVADSKPLPPQIRSDMTLDDVYKWATIGGGKRDVYPHFDKMREFAGKCESIATVSKRRETDLCFLAAKPKTLLTWSSEDEPLPPGMPQHLLGPDFVYKRILHKDMSGPLTGPKDLVVDMVYIHADHNAKAVLAQLEHFAEIKKYIILQSTGTYGFTAEGSSGPGLLLGMMDYLAKRQKEGWFRTYHTTLHWGMSVFSRVETDPGDNFGPGTELSLILAALGIKPDPTCDCTRKVKQMDTWGVEGCRVAANRDWLIAELEGGMNRWKWTAKLKAATLAALHGYTWIDPLRPIPTLYDEAVRRAERVSAPEGAT